MGNCSPTLQNNNNDTPISIIVTSVPNNNAGRSASISEKRIERVFSQRLDVKLREEDIKNKRVHKLLILGIGGCGKSALFKQIITLYGGGFDVNERMRYIEDIRRNVWSAIYTLCQESIKRHIAMDTYELETYRSAILERNTWSDHNTEYEAPPVPKVTPTLPRKRRLSNASVCPSQVYIEEETSTIYLHLQSHHRVLPSSSSSLSPTHINNTSTYSATPSPKTTTNHYRTLSFTQDIPNMISSLWRDQGIQKTYALRHLYPMADSASYFLNQIPQIASSAYCPTEQDVVRVRIRTTSIIETRFQIESHEFQLIDVGGQRNERKKWIHCFEKVTALLFVVALSDFDQVLVEDEEKNRMEESIELFDDTCNLRWFRKTPIILFLNKRDLFQEKVQERKIADYFPTYSGDNSYADGIEYFQKQFESKMPPNQPNPLYCHITAATDAANILKVFEAVKDIIISRTLADLGVM
jgi:GTPase SAR1 family protein